MEDLLAHDGAFGDAAVLDDLALGQPGQHVGDADLADLDLLLAEDFLGVGIDQFLADGEHAPDFALGHAGPFAAVEGDRLVGLGDDLGREDDVGDAGCGPLGGVLDDGADERIRGLGVVAGFVEGLLSIGRRTAIERLAYLLLTLFQRAEEVDFVEAELTNASFKDCDLTNAVFENTLLEGADFRTAFNFSIDPERNEISRARFSVQNVVGLLGKYRIRIE